MSQVPQNGDHIELRCSLGDLQVTIKGPQAQASALLQKITAPRQEESQASPRTESSFDLVSSIPEAAQSSETRSQIAASFAPCPRVHLAQASRLSGSSHSGEDRIRRAWLAGQWAKAVQEGRISTPNRSQQLDLRPRFYAVVRASNISGSALCKSAAAYWRIIEDLAQSSSISHAFPSEIEAQVYFAGAGVLDFDTRQ